MFVFGFDARPHSGSHLTRPSHGHYADNDEELLLLVTGRLFRSPFLRHSLHNRGLRLPAFEFGTVFGRNSKAPFFAEFVWPGRLRSPYHRTYLQQIICITLNLLQQHIHTYGALREGRGQ